LGRSGSDGGSHEHTDAAPRLVHRDRVGADQVLEHDHGGTDQPRLRAARGTDSSGFSPAHARKEGRDTDETGGVWRILVDGWWQTRAPSASSYPVPSRDEQLGNRFPKPAWQSGGASRHDGQYPRHRLADRVHHPLPGCRVSSSEYVGGRATRKARLRFGKPGDGPFAFVLAGSHRRTVWERVLGS
jgi:hypothetical protein